ncbi:TraB/GumN family protein [Salibaculum halophilum]|uniref:TraB/GumN family protein n=1 Tax=Salibaculum halophilum TaxID=1914408 RepID=UPI000A11D879|nr:TraB/GumN family protein [Salibaculum halophilum]
MPRVLLAALLACLALPVAAQCNGPGLEARLDAEETARIESRVAETPFAEGLYWQAERDGRVLTLLGTIHLPDPRLGAVLARVRPRLEAANLLLVEATADDQAAVQAHIAEDPAYYTITEGPGLIERLDGPTWDAVAQAARARGVPPYMAARMQPWFLSMTLSMPPCAVPAMGAGEKGLDNLIVAEAEGKMPLRALEDWRVVLDLLRAGTFEDQLDDLRLGLVAPEIMDALAASMLEGYFDRRPGYSWHINRTMARFAPGLSPADVTAEMREMEQAMLIDRNRSWISVIEQAAAAHDHVFVAFGAAHLIGDQGVLALLQANGWQVTRLDS